MTLIKGLVLVILLLAFECALVFLPMRSWGASTCTLYTRGGAAYRCISPTGAVLPLAYCVFGGGVCASVGVTTVPLCTRCYGPPIPSPPVCVMYVCG